MEIIAERRVRSAELVVVQGDLTKVTADVIVNAANEHLQHGGGVALALAEAGGPAVIEESEDWVRSHGPLRNGRAAVTTAGFLAASHIVHVVGPRYRPGQNNEGMLSAATVAALAASATLGAETVAFPAISAGIFGYPVAEATDVIVSGCAHWLRMHPQPQRILFVAPEREVVDHFVAALPAESVARPGDGE